MNPLGTYNPASFSQQNPKVVDAGLPPAYIRIINSSPYALYLSFGGMGDTVFPEMFLEDFAITKAFNGKITFYPINNIANPGAALTNYLVINAFYPGEIVLPQAQPLTTMSNVGNTVPLQASATSVANDGTTVPTEFIESSISGTKQLSILTDGTLKSLKNTGNANTDFFEYAPADDAGPGGFDMVLRLIWAQSDLAFFDKIGNGEMFRIRNVQGSNSGIIVSGIGGRVRAWSVFSGTGSGTFNHGLQATPNVICPTQNTVGSQTMGWDTANATSVHITAGNGAAWSAIALLMA